jgi:hypothetical protein
MKEKFDRVSLSFRVMPRHSVFDYTILRVMPRHSVLVKTII